MKMKAPGWMMTRNTGSHDVSLLRLPPRAQREDRKRKSTMTDKYLALTVLALALLLIIPERQPVRRPPQPNRHPVRQGFSKVSTNRVSGRFVF
jgi:hypothetical protein